MDLLQSFQQLFGNIKSTFQNAKPLTGQDKITEALNIPRLSATVGQSLSSQNIKNPLDFFSAIFNKAPEQFAQYAEKAGSQIPIVGDLAGLTVGAAGKAALSGPSTFFQDKPLVEHGADILKSVGSVTDIPGMVTAGLINPAITTASTLVGQQRLPTGPELKQSVREGVDFGALFGPVSKIAETVLAPLLKVINPVEIKNINAYLNLAKNATEQTVKDEFYKLAAKRFIQNVGADAIKGFAGFGAYGALQPARNFEERIANTMKQGVEGAVLGGSMRAAGLGLQGLTEQVIKPGIDAYKNMPGRESGAMRLGADIGGGKKPPPSGTKILKSDDPINVALSHMTDLSEVQKDAMRQKYIEVKAKIEKDVVGKPITDAQVLEGSVISKPLDQIRTPSQTKKEMEAILALEKNIADAGKKGKLTPEFIDSLKVLRGEKSYAGRLLRTFGIDVQSQGYNPIMVEVTKKLQDIGMKTDEILKAAEGLNWDNPKDVGKFYREFVKPTIPELLDEYRYINMLSSPKTHLINLFSNVIQAVFTAPATKLYSGAIDFVASKLTGAERTHYVSEVPAFYRGAWNSIGDAVNQAKLALKGETFIGRPDINRLPTGNPILSKAGFITKALEASDVFFRTLIKSGEMESLTQRATKQGKEVVMADIQAQADKNAAYYIFRQNMPQSAERQGKSALNPLNYMDSLTNVMYDLRSKKYIGNIAKFMIPFVETPTNILKQGFEYSPMGLSTIPGAKDKTEQLAKALLGSTIVAGTAFLTSLPNVEITWSAPTDKAAKDNFYQSGRQPFTLRVGDTSIAYNKLGPLSYPIALVAAWKYYSENDPESITENTLQKLTKTLISQVGFFANQSYMEQLGNIVDIAKSGTDITKTLENIGADVGRQLIPLSALQAWVARIIDPLFRKTSGPIENIESGLPGLSTTLPAYTDVFGKPEERNNRIINAFSPVDIGNVNPNPLFESIYTSDIQKRKGNKISAKIKSGEITPEEGMKLFQKLMQSGPTMNPQ